MALDERYIFSPTLSQVFRDKDTGLPLAGGTISFFRDTARSTPKDVFQLTGSPPAYEFVELPNPIVLDSSGQIVNASNDIVGLFYYPFDADNNIDLYYVVVKSAGGVEQFVREAVPFLSAENDPTKDAFPVQNQIANSQFSQSFLVDGQSATLTVSGATDQEFPIGPDWTFVVSGTGSIDVQRVALPGNDNVVTNPPYVLDITISAGITSAKLRQRMNLNSGLWSSTEDNDIFLAGLFVGRNEIAGTAGIQMYYEESSGGGPVLIVDGEVDNGAYTVELGNTAEAIPVSTNVNSGVDGYVDIYLTFNASNHVRVSSVQVIPTTSEAGADNMSYDANSSNREQAFMGDYYIPKLVAKPTRDFLVGWNFPLNPAQFGETGAIGATAAYVWDQTIGIRGADAVNFARSSATGGLELTSTGATDAFYLLQYLEGREVKNMIGKRMAFHMNAYKGLIGDDVTVRVYLFRGENSATIPDLTPDGTIGTLADDGTFTLTQADWTALPRSGLDVPQFTLNQISGSEEIPADANNYGFSEWEITNTAQIDDTDKFAIVVTFRYETTATVITVNSMALTPGDLPCPPVETSLQDTLEQCQRYYEKSYPVGVNVGSADTSNSLLRPQVTSAHSSTPVLYASSFGFEYLVEKRSIPNITLYTPSSPGSSANVFAALYVNSSVRASGNVATSNWTLLQKSRRTYAAHGSGTLFSPGGSTGINEGYIQFHYASDARFGIV